MLMLAVLLGLRGDAFVILARQDAHGPQQGTLLVMSEQPGATTLTW